MKFKGLISAAIFISAVVLTTVLFQNCSNPPGPNYNPSPSNNQTLCQQQGGCSQYIFISSMSGLSIAEGDSISLSADNNNIAGYTGPFYWYRNGSVIATTNSTSHTIFPAEVSHSGFYKVAINDGTESPEIEIIVSPDDVFIPSDCVAGTSNKCQYTSLTHNENKSGSCTAGNSGSCEVSCDNGNVTVSSNSCAPEAPPQDCPAVNYICAIDAMPHGARNVHHPCLPQFHGVGCYMNCDDGQRTLGSTPSSCEPIEYKWVANPWGACSANKCDVNGTKTRTLKCVTKHNASIVVSNSVCNEKATNAKPSTQTTCKGVCENGFVYGYSQKSCNSCKCYACKPDGSLSGKLAETKNLDYCKTRIHDYLSDQNGISITGSIQSDGVKTMTQFGNVSGCNVSGTSSVDVFKIPAILNMP